MSFNVVWAFYDPIKMERLKVDGVRNRIRMGWKRPTLVQYSMVRCWHFSWCHTSGVYFHMFGSYLVFNNNEVTFKFSVDFILVSSMVDQLKLKHCFKFVVDNFHERQSSPKMSAQSLQSPNLWNELCIHAYF